MYGIGFDKDMVKTKRIGTGFKELMKEPRFKKEQEIYEHKLGVYAFKSKKANSAVDKSIDKMKKVLSIYYKEKYKDIEDDNKRNEKIFIDAFTTTKEKNSAGQVGNIPYAELSKIINPPTPKQNEMEKDIDNATGLNDATNLREKMTALCNAAYMNNVRDKINSDNPATTFKRIVWEISRTKSLKEAKKLQKELGLDRSVLDERALESRSPFKKGAGINHRHRLLTAIYNTGIFNGLSKSFNPRDPYDSGLSFLNSGGDMQFKRKRDRFNIFKRLKYRHQHGRGQLMANMQSTVGLISRDEKEDKKLKDGTVIESQEKMLRSLDYYDNMGLNLSNREKKFVFDTLEQEYIEKHFALKEGESGEDYTNRLKKENLKLKFYMKKVSEKLGIDGPEFTQDMKDKLDKLMGVIDGVETDESKKFYEEANNPKSSIKEGTVWKTYKSKGFLADMEKKNNIRIVNGISGTTLRMMKTAKWLGLKGKDLMNFRLALMGWMLPTDDHSLWEIIIGSHNVGVKGKEDMTDMVSLDKTVDPLDEEKLRHNVCSREVKNEPMFPHEIVYWKQRYDKDDGEGYHKIAEEYRDRRLREDGEINSKKGNLFDTAKEKDKREKEVVEEDLNASLAHSPQKSAVLTYTSSDYKGINHAVQMVSSKGISRMIRKHILKNEFINKLVSLNSDKMLYDYSIKGFKSSLTQAKESARQIYKNNKKSENMDVRKKAKGEYKSSLEKAKDEYRDNIKEAKQRLEKTKKEAKDTFHEKRSDYDQYVKDSLVEANMINDSLLMAATSGNKPYEGTVYRGTKIPFISKYRKGGNYRIGTFTSTSKSVTKAKDFIGGLGGLNGIEKKVCYNVLQEVKLTGKHGVDLTSAGVGHDKDARYAMSLCDDDEQEVLNMPGAKWKITDVYEDVPLCDYAGNGNISGIKNEAKKVKEKSSKEDYKNYCEQKKVGILVKMKEIG